MKIDRNKVYAKYGGRCAYCGRDIAFKQMQVDHVVPQRLSFSSDASIHDFSNLMPSCRKCNHYNRCHTLSQFRHLMATLHERLAKIYILEVAQNFGMAEIKPFDGVFYFEKANQSSTL